MPKTGFLTRKAAWEVLQAVSAGAFSDVALDRVLRRYSFKKLDVSLVAELAYGSIRQRYLLDSWIDYLGKVPSSKQPPLLRLLLHLGIYQIVQMERIPASAAINTSVELAKNTQLSKLAPVVNGLLRSVEREYRAGRGLPLPETFSECLALEQSLPIWLVEELIEWRGVKEAVSLAKSFNKIPSFDLRVNRLLTSTRTVQKKLSTVGVQSDLIIDRPQGLQVQLGLGNLRQWPGYDEGEWCVQDRSSQWVAPLLEVQPGDNVLDACAAPGSKTTHLAELVGNQCEIWAVDRSSQRLKRVLENSSRHQISCIKTLVADSTKLLEIKPEWKGYFQKVLLDVPCSGIGTLSRKPDLRWRLTPQKIDELVELQARLLKGVLPLVRPGGRIVYSTCTINPRENFHQIENFISLYPEVNVIKEKQIWPDSKELGDGFFAAILEVSKTHVK